MIVPYKLHFKNRNENSDKMNNIWLDTNKIYMIVDKAKYITYKRNIEIPL